ncbi:hypothetical protein AWV80_33500 [Cupriavidus sp. UYMU48A]|nr:hypothetical protein AWV80_33500 [Cupriavidus sp. UYMU48A]
MTEKGREATVESTLARVPVGENSFHSAGKDRKTAVMRLSLGRGPVDLEDVLYFLTAEEGHAR